MEPSRASKSHFWAALFKPHISILDISLSAAAEEEDRGPHLIGDYRPSIRSAGRCKNFPDHFSPRCTGEKTILIFSSENFRIKNSFVKKEKC